jgi:hypothetical protein
MQSNGGAIHGADGGSTTIHNRHLDRNSITVTDLRGEPAGFHAALCTCCENTLVLRNSTVDGNRVLAIVRSQADSGPSGLGALEFDGPASKPAMRMRISEESEHLFRGESEHPFRSFRTP